jgi:tetratricopeptide (TPR) repeat protein
MEYERAATAFKGARKIDKCVECHQKAADCSRQSRSYFAAAKNYEQAALLLGKDLNQYEKAIEHFEKACAMFREHGVPDTAALCLDRGAKMIENKFPEKAAEFYTQACEVSMIESKTHQSAEFAGKAARVNLKLKNLDAAVDMINKQLVMLVEGDAIDRSLGRVVVHLVLIHLARDDFVAAQKTFNECQGYCESQEYAIISNLLQAFDEVDSQKILTLLNNPFVKTLDNEYAKLARSVGEKHGGAKVSPNHVNSAPADGEPVDEMAGAML